MGEVNWKPENKNEFENHLASAFSFLFWFTKLPNFRPFLQPWYEVYKACLQNKFTPSKKNRKIYPQVKVCWSGMCNRFLEQFANSFTHLSSLCSNFYFLEQKNHTPQLCKSKSKYSKISWLFALSRPITSLIPSSNTSVWCTRYHLLLIKQKLGMQNATILTSLNLDFKNLRGTIHCTQKWKPLQRSNK